MVLLISGGILSGYNECVGYTLFFLIDPGMFPKKNLDSEYTANENWLKIHG